MVTRQIPDKYGIEINVQMYKNKNVKNPEGNVVF